MTRIVGLLLLLCTLSPERSEARWDRIHTFTGPMSLVYFTTPSEGFAGTGWVTTPARVAILKTTDGGVTWTECPSPSLSLGVVSSITLKGSIGYASIKVSRNSFSDISIWKSTDGGNTWFDFSPNNIREAVGVMDVGDKLIVSTWAGGAWVNRLPSIIWNLDLVAPDNNYPRTNGMATNGTDVVVTEFIDNEFYSADGGQRWQRSNDIPEAWSVYNLEGTRSFYTANEGPSASPDREIYRSTNGGASWQMLYRFPNNQMAFTGHIDGKGTRIYCQSSAAARLGMFRSDDLGLSWKSVGGPSGNRDTRFAVQGCGEIVYALDDQGRLFKTIDGGDSTFVADGFYLGQPLSELVGDTVDIPLYIRNISPGTTISGTKLKLNVDRDLLDNWSTTKGSITTAGNTLDLDLTFAPPLTAAYDKARPVAVLRAKNYLTTISTLKLKLNTIDIAASSAIEPCGVSEVSYVQLPSCGDATIRKTMLAERVGIVSITPSPIVGTAQIELRDAADAELIVLDMMGRVQPGCINGTTLNVASLPAGSYVLMLMRAGKVLDRKCFLHVP